LSHVTQPNGAAPREAAAAARFLRRQSKKLAEASAAASAGDPEGVHQTRVACRRARSTIRLLSGSLPKPELAGYAKPMRKIGRRLGDVRDLDMWIESVDAYLAQGGASETKEIRRHLDALRRRARARVRTLLKTGIATRAVADLRRVAAEVESAKEMAQVNADRLVMAVHANIVAFGRMPFDLKLGELHRLRIELKRLRYAIELFWGSKARSAKRCLEPLVAAQDQLGFIQEDRLARRLLREAGFSRSKYVLHLMTRLRERRGQVAEVLAPILRADFLSPLLGGARTNGHAPGPKSRPKRAAGSKTERPSTRQRRRS
jgi:CHAD domain-containing protein